MSIYSRPRVSVLVSVCNPTERELKQCLVSISGRGLRDIELVLIDDACNRDTESTLYRLLSALAIDLKLVTNNSRMGLTKSLNRGLTVASGQYIARIDADDIMLTGRLEAQYNYLEDNPRGALLGVRSIFRDYSGNYWNELAVPVAPLNLRLLIGHTLSHSSIMFRRVLDGIPVRYDESYEYAQDYALYMSLMNRYQIHKLPQTYAVIRTGNSQSISISKSKEQTISRIRAQVIYALDEETSIFIRAFILLKLCLRHPLALARCLIRY